jgi:hypothetical protein
MRNPLRTEAEAFRFLIVVIVGAAIVVGCAYANEWLGVAAAVLVVGGVVWWLRRVPEAAASEEAEPVQGAPTPSDRRRILLLAPAGAGTGGVEEALRARVDGDGSEVLVVVPALAAPLEAITGAVDDRREQARLAAETLAARLRDAGVDARGAVGADEPLLAAEDALREFGADEVLIAGDEELLASVRERLAVPVSLLGES